MLVTFLALVVIIALVCVVLVWPKQVEKANTISLARKAVYGWTDYNTDVKWDKR